MVIIAGWMISTSLSIRSCATSLLLHAYAQISGFVDFEWASAVCDSKAECEARAKPIREDTLFVTMYAQDGVSGPVSRMGCDRWMHVKDG